MNSHADKKDDAPEIRPEVLHLIDLLKWVQLGRIRMPAFQRDFVWSREQIQQLFDSILRQYPIGTLLFWQTGISRQTSNRIGPLILGEAGSSRLLVLDGQQRITALAGTLIESNSSVPNSSDADPGRWRLYFDANTEPSKNPFTYYDDSPPPPSAILVSTLLNLDLQTDWLIELKKSISEIRITPPNETHTSRIKSVRDKRPITADDIRRWTDRVRAATRLLTGYRVPAVTFVTDSLSLAVESFARLNKSGLSIGADEMFSALTYQENPQGQANFVLATEISALMAKLKDSDFGEVGRIAVLRTLLVLAKLDPFVTDWDELSEETKHGGQARLREAAQQALTGFQFATDFLKDAGIPNGRLLPYAMQLVGMAVFFGARGQQPTAAQAHLLRRWLWVTAFTEGFGGQNPSRIHRQLKDLRDRISIENYPDSIDGVDLAANAHPFPTRFDLRSARVKTLLCVQLHELRHMGHAALAHEFARRVQADSAEALKSIFVLPNDLGERQLLSSPANRQFIPDSLRSEGGLRRLILDRTSSGKTWQEIQDELGLICFPCNIKQLSRSDTWNFAEKFLREREQALMALEVKLMRAVGVTPSRESTSAPSKIDLEEEPPLSTYFATQLALPGF